MSGLNLTAIQRVTLERMPLNQWVGAGAVGAGIRTMIALWRKRLVKRRKVTTKLEWMKS